MRSWPLPSLHVQEEINGYHLYAGQPGPDCGHLSDTSSYFDRLKSKELRKRDIWTERFIIHLRRNRGVVFGDLNNLVMLGRKRYITEELDVRDEDEQATTLMANYKVGVDPNVEGRDKSRIKKKKNKKKKKREG